MNNASSKQLRIRYGRSPKSEYLGKEPENQITLKII